jgi:hypothetical protein
MLNKKGDLSINIIIIAAISLLVLIILAVLVLRTGGKINTGTTCVGGTCQDDCDTAAGYTVDPTGSCTGGKICCRSPLDANPGGTQ